MIVNKVYLNNKTHHLIGDGYIDSGDNTFTVIIGKNGTGKSKLLHKIADTLTNSYNNNQKFNSSSSSLMRSLEFRKKEQPYFIYETKRKRHNFIFKNNYSVSNSHLFKKCICVSTSPFDKFPFYNSKGYKVNDFYQYIGLRTDNNNFSKNKLLRFLAQAILNPENKENIYNVLILLGYKPKLKVNFNKSSANRYARFSNLIKNKKDFENFIEYGEVESKEKIRNILRQSYNIQFARNSFFEKNRNNENIKQMSMFDDFDKIINESKKSQQEMEDIYNLYKINLNRLPSHYSLGDDIDDFNFCIESLNTGLLTVSNVILERIDDTGHIDLAEASSGEQCMLLMLLCISAVIENDSVICIDEPEISLHPEWQIEFMPLLMKTFYKFKGCHFILATHSPHIVSKLKNENSFVLAVDDNKLFSVADYQNKSADFQLATLFKSPGYQNEYLNRICVGILSNLSSKKEITKLEKDNIDLLNKVKIHLSDDDSVLMLINIINKAMEVYHD